MREVFPNNKIEASDFVILAKENLIELTKQIEKTIKTGEQIKKNIDLLFKDNNVLKGEIDNLKGEINDLKGRKKKENIKNNVFEWVPCSERLPEKSGEYLVTVNYETIHQKCRVVARFNTDFQKWLILKSNTMTVEAWAELPEVYEA